MRLRVSEDVSTAGKPLRGYATIRGVIQFDNQVPWTETERFRAMEDVVTPKYKESICNGAILNNRMLSQTYFASCSPAYVATTGVISGYPAVQKYPFTDGGSLISNIADVSRVRFDAWTSEERYSVFLGEYSSERALAVAKAFANVSKAEIQALASLGELPETLKWIGSIYTRAISLIKALKAKKLASVIGVLSVKGVAKKKSKVSSKDPQALPIVMNTWLEWRYALRPLIFEMQQAVKALQAQIARGTRFTSRGFNDEYITTTTNSEFNSGWVKFNRQLTISRRSDYRAGVLSEIESDINSIMAIWGLDQPLETVYELTPFSFILDWFFNVGTIIAAWSPQSSLKTLTSWIVEQHLITWTLRLNNFLPVDSPGVDWRTAVDENLGSEYKWGTTIKRRLPLPDRPIMPIFDLKLDMAKIADLAAIGYALLKGAPVKVAKRA